DPVQHQAAAVPHQPGGGARQCQDGRAVGDRGQGRARGPEGRPVVEAHPVTGAATNLFQQQQANRRGTAWLVVGFVLFFAWLGFGGDYLLGSYTAAADPEDYHHVFPWFGLLVSGLAIGFAWYGYRTGPEKVLWSTGAREVGS